LVRSIRPEVDRRTADLAGRYRALAALSERQAGLREALSRQRAAAVEARTRFAGRERAALARAESRGAEAFAAGDRTLAEGERLADLRGEAERRRAATRLAADLAALAPAEPRPAEPEGKAPRPPFDWLVPATGRVTVGAGELLANGVRSRGLTIAAAVGTQVSAPAAGRIVFAGPFRNRRGMVIVDHGGGWMTLLSDVRPKVKVGEQVERGSAIGRALGPVTAELFRNGAAEPAALIARSS
jgi:septal ring factor EnvC (AmiA/AmiB activator)